jgi:hypothetical protein
MTLYDRRNENEDWPSYQRLVLDKLEGLEKDVKFLTTEVTTLRVDMATQKTKISLIGAVAGLISAFCAQIVWHILRGLR